MRRRALFPLLPGVPLAGCAALAGNDPPKVFLSGVEVLPGQGLELRLGVGLRLQNPNETALDFDGVALDLEVRGLAFASGVSDQRGSVPRYGETVITVPVTVSALALVRQATTWSTAERNKFDFVVRGKLGGGLLGTRFVTSGEFDWPGTRGAGAQ